MNPQETLQEKTVRIARGNGAVYPEAVVELLQPYEEQRGLQTFLYVNADGAKVPFEAALAKARDGNHPVLSPLFQPGGKPDVRRMKPQEYRAIRKTTPELLGLRPRSKY